MGDCRIRIVVSKSIFASSAQPNTNNCCNDDTDGGSTSSNETSVSFVRMYSSDTTVREVAEGNPCLNRVFFGEDPAGFTLWDCTLYPPRDITSWPVHDFPDLQGPRSKTLHEAGFFPSGTWMLLPKGETPKQSSSETAYVDLQYNSNSNSSTSANTTAKVEFRDPTAKSALPSQVMESVANRFVDEEDRERTIASTASVEALRKRHTRDRLEKEQQRAFKLEDQIARLLSNSKQNKVSDQVLRMLVKSRATGDKNLKQQDRLYCRCLVLVDDGNDDDDSLSSSTNEYRYFSPQDTFGKIANTFSNPTKTDMSSEVLCHHEQESSGTHARFPVTLRVYEALARGYLSLSKTNTNYLETLLILRWYKDWEDSTPILRDDDDDGKALRMNTESTAETDPQTETTLTPASETGIQDTEMDDDDDNNAGSIFEDTQLAEAIRAMEGKKKKAASAAAIKVRQMKLKSKAIGNKAIRPDDRVFVEVLSVAGGNLVSQCYFLSPKDPLERILPYLGAATAAASEEWEFLVPHDDTRFRRITTPSMLLREADEQEILKSFDRLVVRSKPKHTNPS